MNTSSVALKDKNVGELVHPLRFDRRALSSIRRTYEEGKFFELILNWCSTLVYARPVSEKPYEQAPMRVRYGKMR
uniref:Transposase n=1 Tax=Angiostrongylus cantonensis TaxID=6313 RepID=A0A0K0D0B1_ANGCA